MQTAFMTSMLLIVGWRGDGESLCHAVERLEEVIQLSKRVQLWEIELWVNGINTRS